MRDHDPDLVTLDLGLPGIDGIEACRRIREISDAYVVMITARDDEVERLIGLETGADDFLVQAVQPARAATPASTRCSAARGAAGPAGRRSTAPSADAGHEVLRHGALTVDVDGRRAFHRRHRARR